MRFILTRAINSSYAATVGSWLLSGYHKGETGLIKRVIRSQNRVTVEGKNLVICRPYMFFPSYLAWPLESGQQITVCATKDWYQLHICHFSSLWLGCIRFKQTCSTLTSCSRCSLKWPDQASVAKSCSHVNSQTIGNWKVAYHELIWIFWGPDF